MEFGCAKTSIGGANFCPFNERPLVVLVPELVVLLAVKSNGEFKMRSLKLALAVAIAATGLLTVSSVGSMGVAEAKAHVTKGKPGKCGAGKFYSKKEKGCVKS
jgi:hypothetical protein